MPGPSAPAVELTDDELAQLTSWTRRSKSANALAMRSRIVLAAAEGLGNTAVAARVGVEVGHGTQVAGPVPGRAAGGVARRASSGSSAHGYRRRGVSWQPCKPRVDQDRLSVIFTLPGRTTCEASQPDLRHRRSRSRGGPPVGPVRSTRR